MTDLNIMNKQPQSSRSSEGFGYHKSELFQPFLFSGLESHRFWPRDLAYCVRGRFIYANEKAHYLDQVSYSANPLDIMHKYANDPSNIQVYTFQRTPF